jgi:hypothetical protein
VTAAPRPYTIEFYADPETGREPVLDWINDDLTPFQRRSIGFAMSEILEVNGINICATEYGKNLGSGLFEFRLRHGADDIAAMFTTKKPDAKDKEPIVIRVYCHAYGDKIVLLLAGYDKGSDPSKKRENKEIQLARKRLTAFRQHRQGQQRRRRRRERGRRTAS